MKNKGVILFMLVSLVLVFAWTFVNQWMRATHPEWFVEPTPQTAQNPQPQQAAPTPTTQSAPATQPGAFYAVGGDARTIDLGSPKFDPKAPETTPPLGLSLDSQGASLSSVTLNRYRAMVNKDHPYVFQKPYQNL